MAALLYLTLAHVAVGSPLSARSVVSQLRSTSALSPQGAVVVPPQVTLALQGVTVIDVIDGRHLSKQTVVIVGNRVQAVGPVGKIRIPKGAQIVDARGKYLIPGLWDMHVHLDYGIAVEWYPRLIANGVTGVRELGQRFTKPINSFSPPTRPEHLIVTDSFFKWQREVAAGTRVGPRAVGPSVDLSFLGGSERIRTPEDAPRVFDSLKARGVAFVKYHISTGGRTGPSDGDRSLFFAIAREARRVGLPLVGHNSITVSNIEAADSGLRSIEHADQLYQCMPDWGEAPWDSAAAERRCGPVAQAYLRNGTWLTPTLSLYHYDLDASTWFPVIDGKPGDKKAALERHQRIVWNEGAKPPVIEWKQADKALALENNRKFVGLMHRLGFRHFLAGTDIVLKQRAGGLFPSESPPGSSLLQELVLFAEAGLPPIDALRTATLNPATFFEVTDSLGSVAVGKLADLVLLDADPLADIRNVRQIRAVVANGRYFDRAALDALDPASVKQANVSRESQPSVAQPRSPTP